MLNPQGSSGEGGDQPSTSGSPAAREAQQAASQIGAPASGSDMVPRGLLDRLSQKLERQEAELRRLKSATPPRARETGDADTAAQIKALEAEAEKVFDTDPRRYLSLTQEIASLRAQDVVTSTMGQLFQQQQAERAAESFAAENARASQRAMAEFPELKDSNSEFFRSVQELYDGDPALQQHPRGVYLAAVEAMHNRRSKLGAQARPLEGARTAAPEATGTSDREAFNNAIHALQRKDKKATQRYIADNFDDLLYGDAMNPMAKREK